MNFVIPLVIYPFDVMVSIGENTEILKKRLDKYSINYQDSLDGPVTKGRCIIFDTFQVLIRFRSLKDACPNTIAHESFHAVTLVLDHLGMKLNLYDSDEAYAYLIGYLVGEIHKKLQK